MFFQFFSLYFWIKGAWNFMQAMEYKEFKELRIGGFKRIGLVENIYRIYAYFLLILRVSQENASLQF